MIRLMVVLHILLVWVAVSFAQDAASDARRHLVRGIAAVEMAKSDADLGLAVDEFRKATVIAPNLTEAWFNLGRVQAKMGDYAGAIDSYKHYLVLAPSGVDADKVRDEIIKMEFKNEQAVKVKSRAGVWIAEDGSIFRLTLDGNRMTLVTRGHYLTDADVISADSLIGTMPVRKFASLKYILELQGNKVTGTWSRPAVNIEKCTVPEDGGEVSGELKDADRMLTLRYTRTTYKATTTMGILTDDYCRDVVAVEKKAIEKKFYGPLPKGGIGVSLGGVHEYWPGGFSAIIFGWSGHLFLGAMTDGSPAKTAGLLAGDEIIMIDQSAVKDLSAPEALRRMRGEPGTEVSLSIMRDKSGNLIPFRMKRVAISDDQLGWF
jgi:hypothetical protein